MKISVQPAELASVTADALVINLFQGTTQPSGATGAIDNLLNNAISHLISTGDFTGKPNQTAVLYPPSNSSVKSARVIIVGLGKRDDFTLDNVRQAAAAAARRARDLSVKRLATIVHGAGVGGIDPQRAAQAVTEGAILGLYRFDELKSRSSTNEDDDSKKEIQELIIVELDQSKIPDLEEGVRRGRILAESQCFARTLVTRPGNVLPPVALAEEARKMAAEVGLKYEALEPAQMDALGMGAIMGVAAGSEQPARLIILEHAPAGSGSQKPVVLCGKGITFDTGGISIKPNDGMWQMKDDMGGGAAVIGALRALALLGSKQRTIGIIPAVENMPSGKAIRPGDVLRAMDGQTIEIISTDAEGRLVLADALAYAHRYEPQAMLDVATLTGGVVTALGHGCAGIMANDPDVAERLKRAGETTGERVWELPLWDDEYKKAIRSDIADMKNSVGRAASAIGGGMLLKQFAKKVPWAHVDIAGMAWIDTDSPYKPKGATGYGVRLLAEYANTYAG